MPPWHTLAILGYPIARAMEDRYSRIYPGSACRFAGLGAWVVCRAAIQFDGRGGVPWEAFARMALRKEFARHRGRPRMAGKGLAADRLVDRRRDPREAVDARLDAESVLARLPGRQAEAIRAIDFDEVTWPSARRRLGCGKTLAYRLRREAFESIRHRETIRHADAS